MSIKIKSLCIKYLDEHFWLAEPTKETTERAFRYFELCAGNLIISNIRYDHCAKFKNWLLQSGRSKGCANVYLRALKPVFNWAVKLKLIESNPVVGLKLFKVAQKPIRVYEQFEIDRMLRFATSKLWLARILCGITTGLRRGEVLNLTKDDFRRGFVFVQPKNNTRRTWEWLPKDKEVRKLPLVDELENLLADLPCYYPMISQRKYDNILKLKIAGLLSSRTKRCPDENFRRGFVAIQRKAFGRQVGTFHDLRRTYITIMLEQGLAPHQVKVLSGHSNLETLGNFYAGIRSSLYDEAKKIASKITKMGQSHVAITPPPQLAVEEVNRGDRI